MTSFYCNLSTAPYTTKLPNRDFIFGRSGALKNVCFDAQDSLFDSQG